MLSAEDWKCTTGMAGFYCCICFPLLREMCFPSFLTEAPSLGASTAIFGLLAARAVFIYQNRKLYGPDRTRQAIVNLVMVLVINLAYGFMSSTNIDNMGHIGGFLGGMFFAWKAGPLLRISGQPPFFDIVDIRKNKEITLASLAVIIGFSIIASIPFFAP